MLEMGKSEIDREYTGIVRMVPFIREWDHLMDYTRPGFIQRLIPDTGRKGLEFHALGSLHNQTASFVVYTFPVLVLYQVHLVYQAEYVCCWR